MKYLIYDNFAHRWVMSPISGLLTGNFNYAHNFGSMKDGKHWINSTRNGGTFIVVRVASTYTINTGPYLK